MSGHAVPKTGFGMETVILAVKIRFTNSTYILLVLFLFYQVCIGNENRAANNHMP
jgi:hypothetical protein